MYKAYPEIDLTKCDGCGVCIDSCPAGAAAMIGDRLVISEDCTYCTDCEALCPAGAISCPFEIVLSETEMK
ncbi:MAG: 4Fe-4S binding protein [Chloroflexi bacterium]|nr:4Fe-4S binding protein [Chloroflexota bacterium]